MQVKTYSVWFTNETGCTLRQGIFYSNTDALKEVDWIESTYGYRAWVETR